MILVTLGTQHQEFTRLLDYIEKSKINDEIIVQAGYTKYNSKKMKIFDFIDYDKMDEYVKKADLIITHGGTGSITEPLKEGKKVIACARLSKYGEHVDNHQTEIVNVFADEGYILKLDENIKLDDLIKKSKTFKPKQFKSNTKNFITKLVNEFDSYKNKNKDIVFLVIFLMLISIGFITLVRTPKYVSTIENRTLNKFKVFQIKDFLSKDFQDNFEDALSDQFVGSQTIKKMMNEIQNGVNILNLPKSICKNSYISIGSDFYTYNCEDYLVRKPIYADLSEYKNANIKIDQFNKINNKAETYYYVVNTSKNYDFRTNEASLDLVGFLKNKLFNYKKIGYLEINGYDKYKEYFYKTDHHWNYKGSYQGYKDIASMFEFDNIMTPCEEITFEDTIFYGSISRELSFYDIKEKFSAYHFEFRNHDEYINGKLSTFGNYNLYFQNKHNLSKVTNYYGDFYGFDYAEVEFDYHNDSQPNLLIFSNSYSNSINALIASHFNKTYIIDLRHFEEFKIDEYIEKYDIDKILFIMDFGYLVDSSFNMEGVE